MLRREAQLQWMAQTKRPILIGPWSSEVGFEVLYWLPYLAYLRERYHLDKSRLIAVSRGGAGAWYDAAAAVELYQYAPLEDWRIRALQASVQTGSVKQNAPTDWDRHILALVAQKLGIPRYHVLHPSLMYQELAPWWKDRQSVKWLAERIRWPRLPHLGLPEGLQLPPRYVTARFYVRSTFPADETLITFAQLLVKRISQHIPVVLLNTGLATDDHADIPILGDNVFSVASHMTPHNSLALQSAIMARSQAFIGTYGGLAQLALRLGTASMSFYHQWKGTAQAHLHLSQLLSVQSGVPFLAVRPDEAEMLAKVLL